MSAIFINSRKAAPDPNREYVAVVMVDNTVKMPEYPGYSSVRMVKFTLPESEVNTIQHATWYFLNEMDLVACITGVIRFTDYQNLSTRE